MSALPDLFPGFRTEKVATSAGRLLARVGGKGPPVLLLHGFPQSHAMWHRLAPTLAERFTLILPDLPGYGGSEAPPGGAGHVPYTKRAMGTAVTELAAALGYPRFAVVGHDRGGRVGYRLALDRPAVVERLAVLDIVPTRAMWLGMDAKLAMKVYHWMFLAQPAPLPERLIAGDPIGYLEHTLASWTASRSLDPFAPEALAHYRAFFPEPARVHAMCEDYRAGATTDLAADEADVAANRTIGCPVLALWGDAGIPDEAKGTPLDAWRVFAPAAVGQAVASGHFIPEENPQATLDALTPFLARQ